MNIITLETDGPCRVWTVFPDDNLDTFVAMDFDADGRATRRVYYQRFVLCMPAGQYGPIEGGYWRDMYDMKPGEWFSGFDPSSGPQVKERQMIYYVKDTISFLERYRSEITHQNNRR